MIALMSDCLLFRLANGESVPFSAEMISVELVGDVAGKFDPEILRHATASVFHYFKNELGRETVTVGEFAEALEKVLRGLGFNVSSDGPEPPRRERRGTGEADLLRLARESGDSLELFFFPRLRDELRAQLRHSAASRALSRPARLRQATGRRAPLEFALRTAGGADRRVPPRLSERRTGAGRLRAGGGMNLRHGFH